MIRVRTCPDRIELSMEVDNLQDAKCLMTHLIANSVETGKRLNYDLLIDSPSISDDVTMHVRI